MSIENHVYTRNSIIKFIYIPKIKISNGKIILSIKEKRK